MKFCSKCGKEVAEHVMFCPYCDSVIAKSTNNSVTKFCRRCGVTLENDAMFCSHCGIAIDQNSNDYALSRSADSPNVGFAFLGFLIPLAGLILYLVFKDTHPLKARSSGKGALIGFCAGVILSIVGWIIYYIILTNSFNTAMNNAQKASDFKSYWNGRV